MLVWLIAVIGAFAKRYYAAGWTALLAPFVWGIGAAVLFSACLSGADACSDEGGTAVGVLFFVAWAVVARAFIVAIAAPVRPSRGAGVEEPSLGEESSPSSGESDY